MNTSGLSFADRSNRGKLKITGPQRAWFLHQILTQSFEDMKPGESRDAAMLTAHGRMVAFMETVMTEESILIHFEPELRDTLPDAIQRYVFATQVEISDVTDDMGLVLVLADQHDLGTVAVRHATASVGVPASYLWVPRDSLDDLVVELKEKGASEVSESQLEVMRVTNGVPRWGREMDEKTFPQEVGIDERAVHFDKGCYVGQEAMAKIHFRGKVNRRLATLVADRKMTVGSDIAVDDAKIGVITSSTEWGGMHHALALVRYTIEPETKARVNYTQATVMT